jgi:hypothetical protein
LKTTIDEESTSYGRYHYYGSSERNHDDFETLLSLGLKAKAFVAANKLAKKMASDQWMSTQTTAYCLLAMSKFAQNNGTKGIAVQFKKEGKGNY